MTLAFFFSVVSRRDTAPLASQPAREARCLDLADLRKREFSLKVTPVRRGHASALLARALECSARARSWWNREVRKLAADVLRLPAANGVPPRTLCLIENRVSSRPHRRPRCASGGDLA